MNINLNELDKIELARCPHCNNKMRAIRIQSGYAIICTDKNCLCKMEIYYGSDDHAKLYLAMLVSNWNKRSPEIRAVTAAVECITQYRNQLYNEMQEPYDTHGQCCIDVLDEALNRLQCFTSTAAVDVWINEINQGD